LPPQESCAGENYARCSSVQNDSLPAPRTGNHFKPIELSKTFAAGPEMIGPRIKFRNRDLMARQALQKLRVRAADTLRIRESFCQLSIEEFQEPLVVIALLVLL
jgi:hypothetical protein